MITLRLQWFAMLAAVAFLAIMIELIRKDRVALKYGLLWLFSGVVMLLLAIFPRLLDWVSALIGVYSPVNALFAILLFCGLALMISFSVIMSGNKKANVRLTQEISLLEKRVRELEALAGVELNAEDSCQFCDNRSIENLKAEGDAIARKPENGQKARRSAEEKDS